MVLVDDEDRKKEGNLIMAAEYVSTDAVAFFWLRAVAPQSRRHH
jgi:3,4-dihydroxy-2-butanone 4-phosphate synthase